ncbi:MAG: Glu-tRNA(Gln) amidotransferase subunit GatE [Candidatus Woesearchaeota archaeon]
MICGIEIHQQLEGKKLFCDCPTKIVEDELYDYEVMRNLRAVSGETGSVDIAAQQEMAKKKHFLYRAEKNTSCLVELDEEPPHPINQEAVKTCLQVSELLSARVVDEIQVMRKTVVNGSNTTGFQRTALVAQNGVVQTKEGDVGIETICLEEDACKEIMQTNDHVVYNLSRLGIPLIEIATAPDIRTPEQCRECAEKIGMILRSTSKVKRGLGTIRQDINISTNGGNRIEIKGAQDLKMIPTLVEYEMKRQEALAALCEELGDFTVDEKIHDVTKIFRDSESKVIRKALKKGVVLAIKVSGFAGVLGREVQPGRRVGTEISDYAKIRAGVGGIFHSDELPKYGITDKDVSAVRKKIACEKEAFILVADISERAQTALEAAIDRIKLFKEGVVKEVRKANPDGTTSYLRPIPGADRMYPETDVLPIKPSLLEFEQVELLDDKAKRFEKELGLGEDLAKAITRSDLLSAFEKLVTKTSQKPSYIAEILVSIPREIRRNEGNMNLGELDFEEIIGHVNSGKIPKASVYDALVAKQNDTFSLDDFKTVDESKLEEVVKEIVNEMKGKPFGAIMGEVMKRFGGKVDGKKASEIIKKHL